jgi:hypothetical protein
VIVKFLVVVLMDISVRLLFGVRRADGRSDPRSCLLPSDPLDWRSQ